MSSMADGTPDVQGPAKLPGNSGGIDLDAIKDRANAATEGPWTYHLMKGPDVCDADDWNTIRGPITERWSSDGYDVADYADAVDAEFIAHARQDVPALVTEVERLQAENERLLRWIGALGSKLGVTLAERDAALARIRAVEALCDEAENPIWRATAWTFNGVRMGALVAVPSIRAALAFPTEDGGE